MPNNNKKSMSRTKLIILSLFISTVLWVIINKISDPDINYRPTAFIPKIVGEEQLRAKGFVISSRDEIPPCILVVSGKRNNIFRNMDSIYAEIDVSEIDSAGQKTVKLDVKAPSSINVIKKNYKNVALNIETIAKKENVPVKVYDIDGRGEYGGNIIKSTPLKETVTVYGAKNHVEKVENCVIEIPGSTIQSDIIKECEFYFTDKSNNRIDGASELVSDTKTISVKNQIFETKTAKISEIKIPDELKEKYKISIKNSNDVQVTIGVKKGTSVPSTLTASLDKSKSFEKSGNYTEGLIFENINDNVFIPNDITANITVSLLVSSTENVSIVSENLADNLEIASISPEFNTDSVDVTKPENEKNEIELVADLSGLSAGTHTVVLKPKNSSVKTLESLCAVITLKHK